MTTEARCCECSTTYPLTVNLLGEQVRCPACAAERAAIIAADKLVIRVFFEAARERATSGVTADAA